MRILRKRWMAGLMPLAVLTGLALAPGVSQATIEQGHPELYENGKFYAGGKTTPDTQEGYGQIHLESAQLGSEGIECVNLGFGSAWNEGTAPRAIGSILSWVASGHVPEGTHTKLSASCRPETAGKAGSFATDESNVKSESNGSHEVEPSLRSLSVPWNVELKCGVRSEEYVGIVQVGVPTSEFPHAGNVPCPEEELLPTAQAEEVAAAKKEREEHKGCYVSNPSPAGCIRVTIVEPGAGLEVAYGGTLRAHGINGVHSGLTASKWKFEGATSGELQCEFPAGCTATGVTSGEVHELGYSAIQLITGK